MLVLFYKIPVVILINILQQLEDFKDDMQILLLEQKCDAFYVAHACMLTNRKQNGSKDSSIGRKTRNEEKNTPEHRLHAFWGDVPTCPVARPAPVSLIAQSNAILPHVFGLKLFNYSS